MEKRQVKRNQSMENVTVIYVITFRKNYSHVVSGEVIKINVSKKQNHKAYQFTSLKELLRIII
ncbi:MAG: hypothetical protein GX567_07360 [Clostridia bacterium]|nr:hypothetical protein [Clostridia bacterium]